MVPGGTTHIPPYWWFVATWEDPARILHGCVHYACVRSAPYRHAFRDEVIALLTGDPHSVTVRLQDAQEPVTIERSVSAYVAAPVFTGDECQVFASPDRKGFLVVEDSGPFHTLEPDEARAVAAGEPAYHANFGMDVQLAEPPDWAVGKTPSSFAELVESLGIADRYPGAATVELIDCRYDLQRGRLKYATRAALPIPREAGEAIRNVLST